MEYGRVQLLFIVFLFDTLVAVQPIVVKFWVKLKKLSIFH